MNTIVLFLTVLGYTLAVPNGYYHQEYNYKTSSSSFRNNELQHKTDDQGYYRKDGDLEGRVRPRVDSNSEHSEYINPNLRNGDYRTGVIGAPNGDLSSYGHLRANVGSYGSQDLSEGYAQSDRIAGYSSGAYGASNYGRSANYGVSSNLQTVTSHIQQELERDIQRAIQENQAYARNDQLGISELERELRQNLTNRLNNELLSRYGQQSIRGGLSYTISGGRVQSTANYDNQELLDLRRQLENSLLNRLRTQYNQAYSSSSNSRYETVRDSSYNRYGYTTTTVRPIYYSPVPVYYPTSTYVPFTTVRPSYPNYPQYTSASNQESITTIASRVQNQLDSRLNQILDDVQRRYFSSSSAYSLTNTDVLLERLREELRNNVTYYLNEDIRRNYGTQLQRDGNMYSAAAGGQASGQYNYSVRDLENLKAQIERNLIEKLNRDFERYRSSWSQRYQQSSHSSQQTYGEYNTPRYDTYSTPRYGYTTPRYDVYSTPRYNVYDSEVEHLSTRPTSSHLTSLITNGASSSSSQNRNYLVAGAGQSGYEISGSSTGSISQLQRQLQQDLSRQLQAAISRGHYGSYSTYNPQSYQASLQQLQDELNRNLTRQLQDYSSSSYYSTYGNVDQAQLASLRSQLQADLLRQLQQGLQQSYQSSSSYSASSSSSSGANYRQARGFQNHQLGQYQSGGGVATVQGEDCLGDDPNAYSSHRMKRSYPPYRSQPLGLSSSGGYGNRGNYGYRGQQQVELGQEEDESDLTQQVEDVGSQGQRVEQGQVDESDLTQQVEGAGFGKLQSQRQQQLENDDSDLTQEVEDSGYGKLELGSENQQQAELGQQVDAADLTQQVEDPNLTQQLQSGQQVDDSDSTQQVEDSGLGNLQSQQRRRQQQRQRQRQQVDDSDLTQQVEDSGYGRLQLGSQTQQQTGLGQQPDDSELTQQVEDSGIGKLPLGSQNQQQTDLGQQVQSDLTQQIEEPRPGRLQVGLQGQQRLQLGQQVDGSDLTQQVENPDLTQQAEDSGFGRLQSASQNQQRFRPSQQRRQETDDLDLTQQVEGIGSGTLQLQSQQSQVPEDSDLTQQVEYPGVDQSQQGGLSQQETENVRPGRLRFVSEGQPTPQQIKISNQLEDELSRQLEDAVRNQRYKISYSLTEAPSPQLYQISLQQLSNELQRNISRQLEEAIRSGNRSGQRYSYTISGNFNEQQLEQLKEKLKADLERQLRENLKQEFRVTSTWSTDSSQNNLGTLQLGDFNQRQIQTANQLETDLSKRLSDAVRRRYTITYSSTGNVHPDVIYQNLINEIQRNLTKELQRVGSGSSSISYSYSFNDRQLGKLREQLERDLKLQLQREVTSINSNPSSSLSQQQVPTTDLELQQIDDNFTVWPPTSNLRATDTYVQRPQVDPPQTGSPAPYINRNKNQFALQLQADLSTQLRNAVRAYYSGSVSQPVASVHGQLLTELHRNVTNQLEELRASRGSDRYSYPVYSSFTDREWITLRKLLENNLKFQLQEEIQLQTASQQGGDLELGGQQQVESGQDLTQQLEGNDLGNGQSLTQQQSEFGPAQENSITPQGQDNRPSRFELGTSPTSSLGQRPTWTQNLELQQTEVNTPVTNLRPTYTTSQGPQVNAPQPGSISLYLNRNQNKFAQQLATDLLSQLRNAVTRYYSVTPTSQPVATVYEQLVTELQRNITDQFEELRAGGASGRYSYPIYNSLTDRQRINLRKLLENNLKFELQYEIQQQSQQGGDLEIGGQQQIEPGQDLTQQVETNDLGTGQQQPSRIPSLELHRPEENIPVNIPGSPVVSNLQPIEPSGQQVQVNTPQTVAISLNLNRRQNQFAQQLQADLSSQLTNAITAYYSVTPTSQPVATGYKQLVTELQRNITAQIEAIRAGRASNRYSYSIYSSLTDEQLNNLRKLIENNLKFQLQNEILLLTRPQQSGNLDVGGQQQVEPGLDLTQQVETGQDLTQQVEPGQDLTQQVEPGQDLTQQVEPGQDLTQQFENNDLGNGQPSAQQQSIIPQRQSNRPSRLQFGHQPVEAVNNPYVAVQQVDDNRPDSQQVVEVFEPKQIDQTQQVDVGQAPERVQVSPQTQQTDDTSQLTQGQVNLPQQINNYPSYQNIPSGSLQIGNRPIYTRPVDSNRFIQTEIGQEQEDFYSNSRVPSQQVTYQRPGKLQTLNQVEQRPDRVEPLGTFETDQQSLDEQALLDINAGPAGQISVLSQTTPRNQLNLNIRGQIETTGEGQVVSQPESFGLYLNQEQAQFATRLEDELSGQLQDAINQNNYVVTRYTSTTPSSELYQLSYQQLSHELQRNITRRLQELLRGSRYGSPSFSYSVYNTLTEQQRQRLLNQLQAELLEQLQFNLRKIFGTSVGSSSYGYGQGLDNKQGLNIRGQIHFGQSEDIGQNVETAYDLQPIEPQRANVVQNVDSQANTVGLKGHKGSPHLISTQYGAHISPVAAQETVGQTQISQGTTEVPLPWWKRAGGSIAQGVHNLKDKILG